MDVDMSIRDFVWCSSTKPYQIICQNSLEKIPWNIVLSEAIQQERNAFWMLEVVEHRYLTSAMGCTDAARSNFMCGKKVTKRWLSNFQRW